MKSKWGKLQLRLQLISRTTWCKLMVEEKKEVSNRCKKEMVMKNTLIRSTLLVEKLK
jgi:hypothetical protein